MTPLIKLACVFFLITTIPCFAQLPLNDVEFYSRIQPGGPLPEKLLATRTAVFYSFKIPVKDLESIQKSFQRSGIDAVVYFEDDLLTAGRDVSVSTARYLNDRDISNLVLILKEANNYKIFITEYNKKANFVEENQSAWTAENQYLDELLRDLYRTSANSLKRENFLINDFPENTISIDAINGNRSDFYGIDLKVDPLAVPKFGNEEMDKQLEEIMKEYPFKYTLTEPGLSEAELRKQGHLFVLRFVHARDRVAKTVLGYDMTKNESAIVSITYPEKVPHLKTIPANNEVYKFYFKHIESAGVFLGTKWDADITWQQALLNQIRGFKNELKIN
jgi:hypothetical protein